jgi:hypothetical protein
MEGVYHANLDDCTWSRPSRVSDGRFPLCIGPQVLVAVGIILFATLVYIYLNANFTALMLRMTAEIDK